MSDYAGEIDRDAQGRAVRLGFVRLPERPGERVLVSGGAIPCAQCQQPFTPNRPHQRFCRPGCRLAYFKGRQAMIEWTPAASAKAHAVRGRETKAAAILVRLQAGPADTWELARVGGIRFGARIAELRKAGHRIETEDRLDHAIYRLVR